MRSSFSSLAVIAKEWWQFRREISAAYLLTGTAVALTLLLPWPIKWLIDHTLIETSAIRFAGYELPVTTQVMGLALMLVVLSVLIAVCGAREKIANARLREIFGLHLRDRLLAQVLDVGAEALTQERRGELTLRLIDDTDRVNRLFNKSLPQIARYGATTVATAVGMFLIDWRMGVIALLLLLLTVGITVGNGPALRQASFAKRQREGSVAGLAQEIVAAVDRVRMDVAEARVRERFLQENVSSFEAGIAETRFSVRLEQRLQILAGVATATIAGAGGLLVVAGDLTLGTLTVCIAYMSQLMKPVEKINELAANVAQASVRADRLLHLLQLRPELSQLHEDAAPSGDLTIELRDVCFAYLHQPTLLNSVNLKLQTGRLVALTGNNGSGKSTLVKLLLRLVDPRSGSITINGQPYSHIDVQALRGVFAVCAQRHDALTGSIADQLRSIRADATDEDLWRALQEVELTDFVAGLPQQLATSIREGSSNLSGGQRARLSLAAALVAQRPALILDEPFAAVDDASRQLIVKRIKKLREHCLCLVITHEPSLLQIADEHWQIHEGALTPSSASDPVEPNNQHHEVIT